MRKIIGERQSNVNFLINHHGTKICVGNIIRVNFSGDSHLIGIVHGLNRDSAGGVTENAVTYLVLKTHNASFIQVNELGWDYVNIVEKLE